MLDVAAGDAATGAGAVQPGDVDVSLLGEVANER